MNEDAEQKDFQKIEKQITKRIFLFPIFSIVVLTVILSLSFFYFLNSFKEEKIKELKKTLIIQKKDLVSEKVSSLVDDINHIKSTVNKMTEKDLKRRTDEVFVLIDNILKDSVDKQKKEIIKSILNSIRYDDGRGYFFAYDRTTGKIEVHILKSLIGKNIKTLKTSDGKSPYVRNEEVLKKGKGEGFFTLKFQKPDDPNRVYKKIDFIKYDKKLNWVIGTGEYVDDMTKEMQKNVLNRIKMKRYGKNGYFWIVRDDGILLLNPYYTEGEGKNVFGICDVNGTKFIKSFIQKLKNDNKGAFVEYYWKDPKTNMVKKKIGFAKYMKSWGWIVGSGLYMDDIKILLKKSENKIQKQIEHFYYIAIFIIIVSIIVVILISYYLSRKIRYVFISYRNDLHNKINKAIEENTKHLRLIQQQGKLMALGEMVGAIAHQWRQPLNALAINVQNLEDDYDDGLLNREFLEKFIDKNMKIIRFMSKTIDDFVNFYKTDKKRVLFSVKESIEGIVSILSSQLKNNGIKVEIKGEDFELKGYKNEFQQALLNIINNAKDAILESKRKDGVIWIEIKDSSIIIKDNGGGIKAQDKYVIFEAEYTSKGEGHGMGMGLYMTKLIIEDKLKGKIFVENIKDGAMFKIVFDKV